MKHFFRTLSVVSLMALAAPGFAQTTETDTETETPAPDPLELNMGEPDINVGDVFVEGEYTDWEIRCIKAAEGSNDQCQLYQLLKDPNGNPVAEINIFPIGGQGQPAAGATVITPLETLLTEQLGLSVDGDRARKYPFSWCSTVGCYSRLGLTENDVAKFRSGAAANLVIVPVVAPDQKVALKVSLSGFTAGYKAISEIVAAQKEN